MNRIQKVSTFFIVIFKFLIIFLPALAIFKWVMMDTEFMHSAFAQMTLLSVRYTTYLPDVAWTPLTQLIGLTAYMLALSPVLISLFALIRIFKHYQRNEIFNAENARYYRLIGWMFIFDGLFARSFSDSLMTIAISLNNEPGHRYVAFSFGSPNLEALFCGAVVIIISWVMLEASKLHDEQQYTV